MSLDPELAAALQAHPEVSQATPPPPEGVSPTEHFRSGQKGAMRPFHKFHEARLPPSSTYVVSDKRVSVEGGEIAVRVITPVNGNDDATYPVLAWLHGGGFVVGNLDMDDYNLRSISVELQLVVVNVEYRLAPEHKFPTAVEDSHATLKWIVDNAAELKVSTEKGFLVGGDSAGGNLSAVLALQARDDPIFKGRPLTGQYLREPAVLHPEATPEKYKEELRSFEENKNAPILSQEDVLNFYATYGAEPADIRISPLLATSHAGLPPAFIQVMERDPLRDEGIVYEKALREAGVLTKLIMNPGCVHGFHYLFPEISPAVKIDRDAREGLKWLLSLRDSS